MNQELTLTFEGYIENIKVARSVVHTFLLLRGVYEKDIFDVELGLNEAIANIIQHTYKGEPGKVEMHLIWKDPNKLSFILRDYGPKVDPKNIKPRDLEDIRPGGLGVYLIRNIFDKMEFEDIDMGNKLILEKKFLMPYKKPEE